MQGNTIWFETSATSAALGNAWASLPALATAASNPRQIVGFSGGASAAGSTLKLLIGGVAQYYQYTSPSGGAVQEWFGEMGPITYSSIAVNCRTFASNAQHCSANLMWRIVM